MDERVWHGMDARLGRHLHLAQALLLECLFEQGDDVSHGEIGLLDIGAREIEHIRAWHNHSLKGGRWGEYRRKRTFCRPQKDTCDLKRRMGRPGKGRLSPNARKQAI